MLRHCTNGQMKKIYLTEFFSKFFLGEIKLGEKLKSSENRINGYASNVQPHLWKSVVSLTNKT